MASRAIENSLKKSKMPYSIDLDASSVVIMLANNHHDDDDDDNESNKVVVAAAAPAEEAISLVKENPVLLLPVRPYCQVVQKAVNALCSIASSILKKHFYLSLQGRTPLHEACLRGACRHIVQVMLQDNMVGATDHDHQGNTPLYLLFVRLFSGSGEKLKITGNHL